MSIESFANQHVLELVAYQPGKPIEETARELGLDPHDIVKLASNENPLGPSPKAVEAIARAAAGVNIYPDGAAFRLRSAIAEFCGVEFGQTVVGTGSSEVIELMCHALLNPRAEVVAARHAFSMYPIMSKLFGATYVEVPNKPDWTHDLNGFLDAVTDNPRIVFITNPTNPVGTVVTQQEIDDFMAKVPEHVLVCFDEAYREFVYAGEPLQSMGQFADAAENVIVIDTVSKRFSACGARIGCLITRNRELMAHAMKYAQCRLSVPTLDQVAAAALYNVGPEYFAAVREEYKRRRDTVMQKLQAIPGVVCECPKGAFYVMAALPVDDADAFQRWLLEEFQDNGDTVMFAPGEPFYATPGRGRSEIRIAYVLKQEDLERAMDLLALGIRAYNAR